jgi:hypothetical protein
MRDLLEDTTRFEAYLGYVWQGFQLLHGYELASRRRKIRRKCCLLPPPGYKVNESRARRNVKSAYVHSI